jgi:predicted RNA-binding protein with TRAM domain
MPDRTKTVAADSGDSMELSDDLLCLFNADVERSEDGFVIHVPEREVETGTIEPGEVYRVALLSRGRQSESEDRTGEPDQPQPPVEEGEIRYVEIEDLGKQGDGIARVERGYVIIVPDTDVGERVKVEITQVKSNFAVGEVIEETFE